VSELPADGRAAVEAAARVVCVFLVCARLGTRGGELVSRRRVDRNGGPIPLFVQCKRAGCGQIREVQTREQQATGWYCSTKCERMVRAKFQAFGQVGGTVSGAKRTAALLARVRGLSPIEAYHLGYQKALDRTWRKAQRERRA
jgi:hypothetical protein